MDSRDKQQTIDFQEQQYRLPYHWFLGKTGKIVYNSRHRLIMEMIGRLPGPKKKILDLGCGDGKNAYEIKQSMGSEVRMYGIDFSKQAIGFASLIAPEIAFSVQDGTDTGFAEAFFDLVVTIEVIEHIPVEEVKVFLAEINRLLPISGGLLITTPTTNRPTEPKHFQHFTEEKLRALLEAAGFSVMEVRGLGRYLPSGLQKLYKYLIGLPMLGRLTRLVGAAHVPAAAANTILVSAKKVSKPLVG